MVALHHSTTGLTKAVATACVSVALALGGIAAPVAAHAESNTAASLPDFTEVIEKAEGSVVNIRTTEAVRVPSRGQRNDPYEMFRWFFGPDFMPDMPGAPEGHKGGPSEQERTVPRGVGSGFIISDDGYIITNNHVVAKSNGIFVTLTSGKEYKAEVVGTDSRTDVALIKIDADDELKPLSIGDSTSLKKGQWVLAIGSPFGLDSTVTSGIVSAINRDTGDYLPFIQTDVPVNPGNSGGPLINLDGEAVGVNSQIVSQSGGYMGISLAIPIDEAMRVVDQLKADGKVTRGRIGVQISPVSDDVASALGLDEAQGALVSKVEPDGPAQKAGVRSGDVIIDFNGDKIKHMTDLPRLVGNTKPGKRATLKVWRKGEEVSLKVKVDEMPAEQTAHSANQQDEQQESPVDSLGLKVEPLPDSDREKLGIAGGVVVAETEEPASAAGLTKGDIILMVNDNDITDPTQYGKIVAGLDESRAAAILVMRDQQSQWVALTPRK